MKCIECTFLKHYGGGYYCDHPCIQTSANVYEELKKKRICKYYGFVGYEIPKNSLRHCPYKMMEELKKE